MNLPIIVFLDSVTLDRGDLQLSLLDRLGKVTLYPNTSPSETVQRISSADIVIVNKAILDSKMMAQAPCLRLIAVSATGTNNVDLIAAKECGIGVSNVTNYGALSVAQHALTFMLNWATQMHRFVSEPKLWCQSSMFTRLDYPTTELSGKNLGLLGTGKIGSEVGRLAETFGMTVRSWDRDRNISFRGGRGSVPASESTDKKILSWPRLSLRELFKISDVISLHCPLTDDTRHIINSESLSWMKPGALLINTGRGGLVDELALKEALVSQRLGGAGLDVLSIEPPPSDHLLLDEKIPNLMITPHTAWTTLEARTRLLNEVVLNIEAFLEGKDRNRII